MKDYRVKLKVLNDRILTAINDAGYSSIPKFSKDNNISYVNLNNFINMSQTPLTHKGELSQTASKLCVALNKMPCELFNEIQMYEGFGKNKHEFSLDEQEVKNLLSNNVYHEKPYLDFQDDCDAVFATLSPIEADVLKSIFGLESEEMTLEQIGSLHGLSRERIRQINAKALRKLRHPTRADVLKPYLLELSS